MKNFAWLLCLLWLGAGCKSEALNTDTPVSGTTHIAADATLQMVVESEIKSFERIYDRTKVNCQYGSEAEIFKALLSDSVCAVVAARDLTDSERVHFERKDIVPRYVPIGADAIVLLVNRENPDTLLTFSQLKSVFTGEVSTWNALGHQRSTSDITIVFDNEGSSTVTSMVRLLQLPELPANAYALQTNTEVLDYVAKNRHALGVVGMSWISDLTAAEKKHFDEHIRIVYIRPTGDTSGKYYKPDQINISEGKYPLFRRLQIINCEGKAGLVTGFATYVASPKGQLILLKAGILSATLPKRVVHSE